MITTSRRLVLTLESLEDRMVPAFAVATGPGTPAIVRVLDDRTGNEIVRFQPYGSAFTGGVNVAVDTVYNRVITAPMSGSQPVKVLDATTFAELASFYAYDRSFTGGVSVAVATDADRGGAPDIITGAGPGGGSHVKIINWQTGAEVRSFYAFAPEFRGGVRVAYASTFPNPSDSKSYIVAAAGPGGGPHVKVFDPTATTVLGSFYAFDPSFTGGVSVAVGTFTSSTNGYDKDIVVGAGPGGGAHVKVFDGDTFAELGGFYAFGNTRAGYFTFGPDFAGGVTVSSFGGDITVGQASGGTTVRQFEVNPGPYRRDNYLNWAFKNGTLTVFDGGTFEAFPGFSGGVSVGGIGPFYDPLPVPLPPPPIARE